MKTILARTLLFASAGLVPAVAGNQILLRNLNSGDGAASLLAAGAGGQIYVVSTLAFRTGQQQQISRVVEIDSNGVRVAGIDLPQLQRAAAVTTDPQGNLIVTGLDQTLRGTVLRLDPQLKSAAMVASLPAALAAVTIDRSGNIYLTGATSSAQFPVTAGAYQTTPPTPGVFTFPAYAFLTELSPAGQVVYSTFFGSDSTLCIGGSYCVGKAGTTFGNAIAVDSSGAVTIAGRTTATQLPATPGALATTCVCGYGIGAGEFAAGFAARFRPGAAQQLEWATFFNGGSAHAPAGIAAMALDAAGNLIVGGTAPGGLAVPATGSGDAYLAKINSSGTGVIWGTLLGSSGSGVTSLYIDGQQRTVFGGSMDGATFVARAAGDGALGDFYKGPLSGNWTGPAVASLANGGFAALVEEGAVWIETASPGPSVLNIANSASGQYSGTVSPTELVTLYGTGIGPANPLSGEVQNNAFTTSLGGCQVLFDGVAAPLLYADSGQINAVVPRRLALSMHIQVVTSEGTIDGPAAAVSLIPVTGIFQNGQTGLAAALDQDGSINSPSNPARAGSVVAIFVTAWTGNAYPDGAVVPNGIFDGTTPVWVFDATRSLEVLFAGDAPLLVAGLMQINFRLPQALPPGDTFRFSLQIGGASAPTVEGEIAVSDR